MELRPSLATVLAELQKLQDTLCPEGPDSTPIMIRVYPSRTKALADHVKRRAALAQQQAVGVVGAESVLSALHIRARADHIKRHWCSNRPCVWLLGCNVVPLAWDAWSWWLRDVVSRMNGG